MKTLVSRQWAKVPLRNFREAPLSRALGTHKAAEAAARAAMAAAAEGGGEDTLEIMTEK